MSSGGRKKKERQRLSPFYLKYVVLRTGEEKIEINIEIILLKKV